MWKHGSNVYGKLGHRPRHVARIMESHNIQRWLIAAHLREMSGLEGKAMFECVERSFNFNRCLRQGSVEAPRLWQIMAAQLFVSVEGTWRQKNMGLLLDFKGEKVRQICSSVWADNFWIMSHSNRNLERMLRDLIEEAEKWDLAPKTCKSVWTSTHEEEERSEVLIATNGLMYRFPLYEKFKILGCAMNRQGKSLDVIEERKQSANKVFWRDILVWRSKDVPLRNKCRRLVDHVYSVFSFGSENWSWTIHTRDRINGWETKMMMRLFRIKRGTDGTWVEFHIGCCKAPRKIWIQMGLPFLNELKCSGPSQ